jgi:DUF438 domain-containing protein
MEKCKQNSLAEELTGFLMKLNKGRSNEDLQKEASRLLSSIGPSDFTNAQRRLARNGLPVKRIQQLCETFIRMGVLEPSETDLRTRLPAGHILRKIMAEHEMTQCFIADLEEIAAQIRIKDTMSATSSEFMRLAHIVEHLNALAEHTDREDDVLFPVLREQGWDTLFTHIEHEHTYIHMSINDLVKLITAFEKMPFSHFKTRLMATVNYLCPLLRDHLIREDRAMFPLAVSMIRDAKVWDKLRQVCNEIDYCGIHL